MMLFGRELFKFKKEAESMWDFAKFGLIKNYAPFMDLVTEGVPTAVGPQPARGSQKQKSEKVKKEITKWGIDFLSFHPRCAHVDYLNDRYHQRYLYHHGY